MSGQIRRICPSIFRRVSRSQGIAGFRQRQATALSIPSPAPISEIVAGSATTTIGAYLKTIFAFTSAPYFLPSFRPSKCPGCDPDVPRAEQ
jgi:hypothetical protein